MEPYYKKNGFYDRLERLSDLVDGWIDFLLWHADGFMCLRFLPGNRNTRLYDISYAIMNERVNIKMFVTDPVRNNDIWVTSSKASLAALITLYNREKYWWMAKK